MSFYEALMVNQVEALQKLGIRAAMLTSKTSDDEKLAIEKDMKCGHPRNRLLYGMRHTSASQRGNS